MSAKLSVELAVIDRATKELNGIAREFNTFQTKVVAVGQALSKIFVGGMITGAIVGEFKKAIASTTQYAWETERMANITGMSVEEVQRLDYVLKQSSSSMEEMKKPIQKLSVLAFENSKMFSVLGVSVKDSSGNLKGAGQIFEETVIKLGEIKNTTERAAIAHQLFGRGAAGVLNLIATGADNMKRYSEETEKYGLILNEKTIKSLDEAKKSSELFDKAMQVMSANIVVEFAPAMVEMAKGAATWAKIFQDIRIPLEYYMKILHGENLITAAKEIQVERTVEEAKKTGDVNRLFELRAETLKKIDELQLKPHYNPKDLEQLKAEAKAYARAVQDINDAAKKKNAPGKYNSEDFKSGESEKDKEAKAIEEWAKEYNRRAEITKRNNEAALKEDLRLASERTRIFDQQAQEEMRVRAQKREMNKTLRDELTSDYQREIDAANDKYDKMEALGANYANAEMAREKALTNIKTQSYATWTTQAIGNLQTIGQASKANANVMKRLGQAEAAVNTAVGATKALSATPWPPVNFALMALQIAAGVAQMAIIEQQQFAHGTSYAPGGMAVVGEHGPEAMYVPRGAQIYTATETKNMQNNVNNNSGHTFNISFHDASGNLIDTIHTQLRSGTGNVDRFVGLLAQKMGAR